MPNGGLGPGAAMPSTRSITTPTARTDWPCGPPSRRLPLPQREAVVLRYFLQLSVEQTAQRMGRTNQAVRNLTHRALRALRESLDADVDVEESADAH